MESIGASSNRSPIAEGQGGKPFGLHVHDGDLVARLNDGTDVHSLQFISGDGRKRFLPSDVIKAVRDLPDASVPGVTDSEFLRTHKDLGVRSDVIHPASG